jgi:hypothetical protein
LCPSNQISSTVAAEVLGVASGAIYTWAISDAVGGAKKIETLHPEGIQGCRIDKTKNETMREAMPPV